MKYLLKNLICILLALLMTISIPSFSAFAEEETPIEHVLTYTQIKTEEGTSKHSISCSVENCDVEGHNVVEAECSPAEEKVNVEDATCTEEGYTGDIVCADCGAVIETGTASKMAPHKEVSADNAVAATCTTAGKEADIICSVCKQTIKEGAVIPAKGHKEAAELYNVKSPTCKAEGYTGDKVCSVCNAILEKGKSIDKVEHSYVLKTTPECNKDDSAIVLTYECIYCGEKGTEYSVVVGHTPFVDENTAVEPTCEKAGKKADTVCSKCEKTLVEGDEIPATGHKWENGKCTNKDCDAKATPVFKSINKTKYFIDEKFDSEIVLKYQYGNKDTGEEVILDGSKIEVAGYDNTKAQSLTDCKITYDKTDITLPDIKICSTDISLSTANGSNIVSSYNTDNKNILDGTDYQHPLTVGNKGMTCTFMSELNDVKVTSSNTNIVISNVTSTSFKIASKDGKNPGVKENTTEQKNYYITITGKDNMDKSFSKTVYVNFGIKSIEITNDKNDYTTPFVYNTSNKKVLKRKINYYYGTSSTDQVTATITKIDTKYIRLTYVTLPSVFGKASYYKFKVVPKGTSLKTLSATSKGFKATWTKQATLTTGYQIQYSTSSKLTSAKTVTISKNSTVSKTISKLVGNKKYYVRIRTYTKNQNGTFYSSWSGYKAVTTKK